MVPWATEGEQVGGDRGAFPFIRAFMCGNLRSFSALNVLFQPPFSLAMLLSRSISSSPAQSWHDPGLQKEVVSVPAANMSSMKNCSLITRSEASLKNFAAYKDDRLDVVHG
ncbi:hypothetical protein HPP92_009711 [Vanilla planifolia]|uniref:Uncharacterized protein n=1 Tax=Vanilla planifolia TaxID=51239 RepID=A0A835RD91_VANPL|nr:hypothetical protein HPP92_009929 [Vanilla planifolia]KAG0487616.1 hypothetical protein HPP92_009711 [Vanilla planifolia]